MNDAKLARFTGKTPQIMYITMQVNKHNESLEWSEIEPVLHEVTTNEEAVAIAYALSKHFNCHTVRVAYVDNWVNDGDLQKTMSLADYASRMSGHYFQAHPRNGLLVTY